MAIEWLRMLFEWDDILRTHKVIKYYVNSIFTNLKNSDKQAVSLIQSEFATLKSKITTALNDVGKVFGSQSFNGFITHQHGGSSSSLAGQTYHQSFNDHAVRCNYVRSKAEHHFASTTSLGTTLAAPADSQPFANLLSMIQQQVDGLQSSTAKLQSLLQVKTGDPTKFFELVVVAFLEAAADVITFVLDVIEDIAVALLDLVDAAITALQDTLNANLDIPIISWLYKYVITGTITDPGDDLTILDLLCLIIAVPATILYKVLFGGSAPFTSKQVAEITSSPIPWPSLSAAGAGSAPGTISPTQEILLAVGAIAYFLYMICDVAIDGLAAAGDEGDDSLATFLSWAAIVLALVILGLTVPYNVLAKSEGDWSVADKGRSPTGRSASRRFFSRPRPRCSRRSRRTPGSFRSSDRSRSAFFGAGVLGIGVWTTVEQALDSKSQDGWTEAGNIITPIPASFAWLLPLTDATDGASAAFLMGIAAICDIGAMVTTVAGEASS